MTTTSAPKRDGFSSGFGVLAATLGSAVGLGNIWKVPYLTGANGGAGFLVLYLAATLLIGLPVMMAELAIGREAHANPVTAMQRLAPKPGPWWLVGVLGMAGSMLIVSFYSEVAAWVFAYIAKSAGGGLLSSNPQVTAAAFEALIRDPWQSLLWQWLVLAMIGVILALGVAKGIEAVTKRLMPLLFLLLLVLCGVSLTLDKAGEGLAFMFMPELSKLSTGAVLTAMGLAFFKLSLGMGTMITYGSYFGGGQNIPATAVRVMCADLCVSMLAGIAIFPAVFTFGFAPEAGPSLVFITLPAVFAQIPLGQALMAIFFVLTAVAATGALLSLVEVPVAILSERFAISRRRATGLTIAALALPSATGALSQNVLAGVTLGGLSLFDFYDYVSSNIVLPLGGILVAVFIGWVWGAGKFREALSNHGALTNRGLGMTAFVILKYVSPVLILVIMARALGLF
ncbi:sodium-dependent transporter [Pusillimonas sp. TS35]|uniref:sodium-dependent transporter n=1 Tax=Paracandidimonas lactea TaxID=2895524 RepID=UPI00136E66FD|nr:sodium-dependent transporter [Paracandidimonas lactea]MYN11770.1 sodium-dependent transporter [Pusillimonas sp. TS35]